MKTLLAVLGAALFLSACAGAVDGNPQSYAGINMAEFNYHPGTGAITSRVIGGKEAENVKLSISTPKGLIVVYEAEGLQVVDRQLIRAAVEKAVSDNIVKVLPGIVGALKPGFGLGGF